MIGQKPTKPCPDCKGEGYVWVDLERDVDVDPCERCDETGRVPVPEAELEAHGQLRMLP